MIDIDELLLSNRELINLIRFQAESKENTSERKEKDSTDISSYQFEYKKESKGSRVS